VFEGGRVPKDYYCEECRGYEQRLEQCEYQIHGLFAPLIKNYASINFNQIQEAKLKERELGRARSAIKSAYEKHVKETHAER
jgi:hypothetical protein